MIRKISLITMFVVMVPVAVVAQDPRVAAATARIHGNIVETIFSGLSVCDKERSLTSLRELQKKYELLGWQTATIKNIFSLIIGQIEQANQNDRESFTRARDMLTMFFDASEHRGADFLHDVNKHLVAINGIIKSTTTVEQHLLGIDQNLHQIENKFPELNRVSVSRHYSRPHTLLGFIADLKRIRYKSSLHVALEQLNIMEKHFIAIEAVQENVLVAEQCNVIMARVDLALQSIQDFTRDYSTSNVALYENFKTRLAAVMDHSLGARKSVMTGILERKREEVVANVDRALKSVQEFRSKLPVSEYVLHESLQRRLADFEALLVQLRENPLQYFTNFETDLAWLSRNSRVHITSHRAQLAQESLACATINNSRQEEFFKSIRALKQAPRYGLATREYLRRVASVLNPMGYVAQAVFPVADKVATVLGAQTTGSQGPGVYVRPTTSRAAQLVAREQPMLSLADVLWVRKYARLIHWFVEPSFRRNGILARLIKWTASRIDASTEESVLRMEKAIKLGVPVGKLLMGLNEFIAARRGVSNWVDGASDYIRRQGVGLDNDFARTLDNPQGIASRAVNGVDAVRTWSCMNRMTVGERQNTLAALKPTELLQQPAAVAQ